MILERVGDMFATVSVDRYSFPSGHTTRVVTIAALAQALSLSPSLALATAVWAMAVSVSRIILGTLLQLAWCT
jgi:membrane-associated phospholipid phosphatase